MTITEGTSVEQLAKLLRDNMWKLYRLPESVISNKELQFVAELTKESNKILEIETRLLIAFHLQTDRQIEWMNQELEQYLKFFTEYRQKDWPEWLVTAEFVVNNKVYLTMKVLSFMANCGKELRMGAEIRRKGKVEKTEFAERFKKKLG